MKEPTWIIPANTVKLPDGSTLVKPGKAIQRATTAVTAKLTGIDRRTLHALADTGYIRRQQPSRRMSFFFPGEIEDFLLRTESDPRLWESVKTGAFLTGKDLRNSKPR